MEKRTASKRGGRGRAPQTGRPEYELHVRGAINTTDDRSEAELRSPVIDPTMHPSGVLRVDINTDVNKKPKLSAVLDAFHVESLHEYVRGQVRIRKALEQALKRDQAEWDPDGPKLTPDKIWSRAKIESLDLRRRDVADAETVASLKEYLGPKLARDELASYDPPDTRSFFTVVLECDWDDEHLVRAEFRDGKLTELKHE